jgi:hypothetical protein
VSNILMHANRGHLVSVGSAVRWEKCAGIRPQFVGSGQAQRELEPATALPVYVPTADAPTGVPPSAPGRRL